jgi:copper resistance protein D
MVAILLLTGLVNSWMLVGSDNVARLWTTRYGQLLIVKFVSFGVMIGPTIANRFRLTPALGRALSDEIPSRQAISSLRCSIALETILGVAVLFLVAWFGTMEPPAAM